MGCTESTSERGLTPLEARTVSETDVVFYQNERNTLGLKFSIRSGWLKARASEGTSDPQSSLNRRELAKFLAMPNPNQCQCAKCDRLHEAGFARRQQRSGQELCGAGEEGARERQSKRRLDIWLADLYFHVRSYADISSDRKVLQKKTIVEINSTLLLLVKELDGRCKDNSAVGRQTLSRVFGDVGACNAYGVLVASVARIEEMIDDAIVGTKSIHGYISTIEGVLNDMGMDMSKAMEQATMEYKCRLGMQDWYSIEEHGDGEAMHANASTYAYEDDDIDELIAVGVCSRCDNQLQDDVTRSLLQERSVMKRQIQEYERVCKRLRLSVDPMAIVCPIEGCELPVAHEGHCDFLV